MKLIKQLTLFLFTAALLVGCSKDDDKGEASLLGTWKITAQKMNDIPIPLDECDSKSYIVISASTIKMFAYYGENCEELETEEMPYVRNGNKLTVGEGSESDTVEIVKLTATTLEIKNEEQVNDQTIVLIQTFTRQ